LSLPGSEPETRAMPRGDRVILALICTLACGLHSVKSPIGSPAFFGDASNQIVDEIEIGFNNASRYRRSTMRIAGNFWPNSGAGNA
jgi:hypothetical protein